MSLRFTAYDGSAAGPEDAPIRLHLENERGLSYLVTAPGDLGMARAYVSGDLTLSGVHPGNPYPALVLLQRESGFKIPPPAEAFQIARGLGWSRFKPPPPPPQEALPSGAGSSRASGTPGAATPGRSTTTTTSRTGSTRWSSGRR